MSIIPSSSSSSELETTTKKHRINYRHALQNTNIYDASFSVLKTLNNKTLPQSMNRITTNSNVKIFLVKNKLIKEIPAEDNLKAEYLTYKYYSIDLKGQEFIQKYEEFKKLVS